VHKQKNSNVVHHATAYLSQFGTFSISAISWYEVVRGLRERNATAQLFRFATFCQHVVVLQVDDMVLDRAANLWVESRRLGRIANDADLIIAATAMHHGCILVTGNTAHFQWISGLTLANWRDPP
jgi:tRNA(fMet)-specific endonuclease VapC